MRVNKNQNGFTAIEAIIIIVVVVALGAVGWLVYKDNHKNSTSSGNSSSISSWYNTNYQDFAAAVKTVGKDVGNVAQDVVSQNATGTQTDCQQAQTDITSLQQIPAYPVASTNAKVVKAESELSSGATDCLNGLNQGSSALINQAGSEFTTGLNDLTALAPTLATK
jgi:Tfp pilus assembly major pilin PilA